MKPGGTWNPANNVVAATFGWLCVETYYFALLPKLATAATFGWLCVETVQGRKKVRRLAGSHLRVAVC